MKYWTIPAALAIVCASQSVCAGDKVEAAVGGAAGGAIGAVIGDELGDRNGAIVGAAAGAAIGTAIATSDHDSGNDSGKEHSAVLVVSDDHPDERFCPPGQAKKGRC
jgi:outer membrane lipoprotein SlyB